MFWGKTCAASEPLETRILFATSITLQSSQLIITGTNGLDTLRAAVSGSTLIATANGMTRSFALKDVKSIVINGKSGDDLMRNDTNLPSTLTGGAGNDTLKGGTDNDALNGGGGSDLLRPGNGNNSGMLDASNDRLDYRDSTDHAFGLGAFNGGIDSDQPPVRLSVSHGSAFDDFKLVSSDHSHFQFFATPGNDGIGGDLHFDVTVHGGSGNDTISVASGPTSGTLASLYALGEDGNDTITGEGEDISSAAADGGPGDDHYIYQNSHSGLGPFVDTGGGHDLEEVETTPDAQLFIGVLPSGIEDCTVSADGNYDLNLTGNDANNRLEVIGDANHATINGGGGNDTITDNASDGLLIGGDGNDSIVGGPGNDVLQGGAGNDTLIGGPGNDALLGQSGNDKLFAKDGEHDFLDGGSGTDSAQRDKTGPNTDQVLNVESFV